MPATLTSAPRDHRHGPPRGRRRPRPRQDLRHRRRRRPRARRRLAHDRPRRARRRDGPLRAPASRRSCTSSPASTGPPGGAWIGDDEISALNDDRLTDLRRRHVGFIFQLFNLLPMLSAKENILLPSRIAGRKARRRLVRRPRRARRASRPPRPPPVRALGRSAAARRDRPGARRAADGAVRRRAHRQPRHPQRAPRCSSSSARPSSATARPPSWSPTTRGPPRSPTASCSSPTARS